MGRIKATVKDGRLVVDTPTSLPEGLEVDLVIDDGGDDLDEDSRAKLHAALQASAKEAEDGLGRPAGEVLASLGQG